VSLRGASTKALPYLGYSLQRVFNCTEACPREIRITKAIGEVKKAILKGSPHAEPIRHAAAAHG
jgi:hypothetical protein